MELLLLPDHLLCNICAFTTLHLERRPGPEKPFAMYNPQKVLDYDAARWTGFNDWSDAGIIRDDLVLRQKYFFHYDFLCALISNSIRPF